VLAVAEETFHAQQPLTERIEARFQGGVFGLERVIAVDHGVKREHDFAEDTAHRGAEFLQGDIDALDGLVERGSEIIDFEDIFAFHGLPDIERFEQSGEKRDRRGDDGQRPPDIPELRLVCRGRHELIIP